MILRRCIIFVEFGGTEEGLERIASVAEAPGSEFRRGLCTFFQGPAFRVAGTSNVERCQMKK
jgi:hypothetical protein